MYSVPQKYLEKPIYMYTMYNHVPLRGGGGIGTCKAISVAPGPVRACMWRLMVFFWLNLYASINHTCITRIFLALNENKYDKSTSVPQ